MSEPAGEQVRVGEPVAIDRPGQCGPQVVEDALDGRVGGVGRFELLLERARDVDGPGEVARADGIDLAGFGQLLEPVGAHGFEQPVRRVAGCVASVDDETLPDQPRDRVRQRGRTDVVVGQRRGVLQAEGTVEERNPPQRRLLLGVEQAVTPIEHGAQRPVAFVGSAGGARSSNRSPSASSTPSTPRVAHRAAASSMASGIPSSRAQISAIASRSSVPSNAPPGLGARDEQRDRPVVVSVDLEWAHGNDALAGHAEHLAARRQHDRVGTRLEQPPRHRGGRVEHVLAIVEHQQRRLRRERFVHRLLEREVRPIGDTECRCDRRHDVVRLGGYQVDEPLRRGGVRVRGLDGQPRLPTPPGPVSVT